MRDRRKRNNRAHQVSWDPGGVVAVVPAAGLGRRFGRHGRKVFFSLLGKPVLVWALQALQAAPEIGGIVVVLKKGDLASAAELFPQYGITKVTAVVAGGRERQDSVWRGLQEVPGGDTIVLIHDGARPLVSGEVITRCLDAFRGCDGVVAGVPLRDTVKEVADARGRGDGDLTVRTTMERSRLWAVQTPQVFRCRTLREAHERARREAFYATDDAALVERCGGKVKVVPSSHRNIKITTGEDLIVAEALCRAGLPAEGS